MDVGHDDPGMAGIRGLTLVPMPARGLLAQLDVPVGVLDPMGQIVWANQACSAASGLLLGLIVGDRPPYRHWPPSAATELGETIRLVISGDAEARGLRALPYRFRTTRGRDHPCEIVYEPIRDESGVAVGFLCALRPPGATGSAFALRIGGTANEGEDRSALFGPLSRREQEVVSLLLEGLRVPSIARRLFLSQHTVRNHLKSVYRKLGVRSQTALIERALGSGPGRDETPVPQEK